MQILQPWCIRGLLLSALSLPQWATGQVTVLRESLDDATGSNLYVVGTGLDPSNNQVNQTSNTAFRTTATVAAIFGFDYGGGEVGQRYLPEIGEAEGPFFASIPEAPNSQPGDASRTGLYLATNT